LKHLRRAVGRIKAPTIVEIVKWLANAGLLFAKKWKFSTFGAALTDWREIEHHQANPRAPLASAVPNFT